MPNTNAEIEKKETAKEEEKEKALEDRLQQKTSTPEQGLEARVSYGKAISQITPWEWAKILALYTASASLTGGIVGFGAINTLTTAASFVASDYYIKHKEGFKKEEVQTNLLVGGGYTIPLYYFLNIIEPLTQSPLAWMAAYAFGLYPFTITIHGMERIMGRYSPKTFITEGIFKGGLISDIGYILKDTVTTSPKAAFKAALALTIPTAIIHYALPFVWLIPALFFVRGVYRILTRPKEKTTVHESYQKPPLEVKDYKPDAQRIAA